MRVGRLAILLPLILAACAPVTSAPPPSTATSTLPARTPSAQGTEVAPASFLFVDQPIIVRSGPGVIFPVTTEMPAQRNYRVIAKNVSWWLVDLGAGHTGWVYGEVYTTNFVGDPQRVPEIAAPSTPTAHPSPTCGPPFRGTNVPGQGIEQARVALAKFFDLLNAGEYHAAAALYAGDYEVLRDNNPLVGPDGYAALLRNACEINGYQCLKLLRVVSEEQSSPAEFQFTVEFVNPDGSTFVRGQCCGAGETDMPSQSQFPYTVRTTCQSDYHVMDMPVYVP